MNPTKFFVSPTALFSSTLHLIFLHLIFQHGLFYPRYFENGPLEPGYIVIIVAFISKVVYICFSDIIGDFRSWEKYKLQK